MVKREKVASGTGNVFVDLGYPDAAERGLRVELAIALNELLRESGLTQTGAAAILGIPQPHVSELKHYKLRRFSSERLLRFLALLGRDVEIVIRPLRRGSRERTAGEVSVSRIPSH